MSCGFQVAAQESGIKGSRNCDMDVYRISSPGLTWHSFAEIVCRLFCGRSRPQRVQVVSYAESTMSSGNTFFCKLSYILGAAVAQMRMVALTHCSHRRCGSRHCASTHPGPRQRPSLAALPVPWPRRPSR